MKAKYSCMAEIYVILQRVDQIQGIVLDLHVVFGPRGNQCKAFAEQPAQAGGG